LSFERRADALLKAHLARGDFSGVVLVAHNGRPIFRRAYGLANREWNVPVTVDTEFRIGSVTKQFTAAAIFQLIEAGKVALDDPVSTYVEGLPHAWTGITIRQLLNHTSGIADFVQYNGFIHGPARLDLMPDQILDLVRDQPLEFAPGSRFKYTNTGYALLGMIIERISGQSYADYMQQHVLRALNLNHTAYDDTSEILPRRADGYWLSDGVMKNARPWTTPAAYAGGVCGRTSTISFVSKRRCMGEGSSVRRQLRRCSPTTVITTVSVPSSRTGKVTACGITAATFRDFLAHSNNIPTTVSS
jgi:CubicO group peptidase (beta-lactamase class C family)